MINIVNLLRIVAIDVEINRWEQFLVFFNIIFGEDYVLIEFDQWIVNAHPGQVM